MKRMLIWIVGCGLLLTGCGTAALATAQTGAAPVAEVTEPVTAGKSLSPFYFIDASDMDEITAKADVILEMTVQATDAVSIDDKVRTVITPEIMNVYKGSYDDAVIYATGGDMNLQAFYEAASRPMRAELAVYSPEERETGVYQYRQEGCPLVQPGERYLFFGTVLHEEGRDGDLMPLNTVEGFYACDDEMIWLDKDMYYQPLCDDLRERFGVPEADTETQYAISKADFLAAIG